MSERKVLNKPVDWDELYPGRFIKATEFKGKQVTLRITNVELELLHGDKGEERKGVISFQGTEKMWAINRTNGICAKAMFGSKVQEWIGKRITLFPSVHDGEPCIRVWGSPDIEKDFDVLVQLPRKRPFTMTMHKTGARPTASAASDHLAKPAPAQRGQAQPAPPPEREPGSDDDAGGLTLADDTPAYDPALSREIDLKLVED